MDDDRKRRDVNWSSVIGWVIFIGIIAAGPLSSLFRSIFGAGLPPQTLPILIGALIVLSIVVSAFRALSRRSRSDTRLPTSPIPPRSMSLPPPAPRTSTLPTSGQGSAMPSPPRFDPVINPGILLVGIVGLLLIGGVVLLVFGSSLIP